MNKKRNHTRPLYNSHTPHHPTHTKQHNASCTQGSTRNKHIAPDTQQHANAPPTSLVANTTRYRIHETNVLRPHWIKKRCGNTHGHQTPNQPPHHERVTADKNNKNKLLRKEVIQPHLPVRLPCYDFVPIANPTFDHSPRQKPVRPWASGVTNFHDVTGGVYKARERIHRSTADLRLLATPTS